MSTDADEVLTTYPGSPYTVLPLDTNDRSALPADHGALAIDSWLTPSEEKDPLLGQGPIIGIDGKPAAFGFGRALVVVPAGERLVEVQVGGSRQTTPVTIAEGQVLEFEYSPGSKQAHRGPQGRSGLPGLPASRPRSGITPWLYLTMAIAAAVGIVVAIGVTWYDGVPAVGLLAAVVGLYFIWVGYRGWKGGRRSTSRKRRGKR
ncbi:MAG: hypothetical protein ACRDP8_21960 [Actinopolymorphaceae bacterium]